MTFGVTTEGFIKKTQEDIKAEIEQDFKDTFGTGIDLDPRRPFGQLIGLMSGSIAANWDLAEQIYNSQNPQDAEGVPLDDVASYTGTIRDDATKSFGNVVSGNPLTLFGVAGTLVPKDSIVSVSGNPDAKFLTAADATILPGINEIQRIAFASDPVAGTFTVTKGTETSDPIAWNESAINIKTILENMPNVDTVAVTKPNNQQIDIEFQGGDGEQDQALLIIATNTLESKEITQVQTVADSSGSLGRTGFILYDKDGSVGVWIDVDDSGSSPPADALAADRQIEVTGVVTDDTADAVAAAIATALQGDAEFAGTTVVSNTLTIPDTENGTRTDAFDMPSDSSGFTVTKIQDGADPGDLVSTVTETQQGAVPQVDVDYVAQTAGATAAPSGSLSVIETPVAGWSGASNALDATVGQDVETDAELKVKRLQELANAGSATINAIFAKLISIDEVTAVVVFENDTDVEDVDGRPPHSLDIVVEGSDEETIANAIFDVVAGGITLIGDITEQIVDSQGNTQDILFSRPDDVDIWVEIDLSTDPDVFPVGGEAQVAAAILAFGNALSVGEDVIVYPELICAFNAVDGITDVAVRIGTAASPTLDDNITIAPRERSKWDSSRIAVAVV